MQKEKIIAGFLGVAMVAALAGIGYGVWNAQNKTSQKSTEQVKSAKSTAKAINLSDDSSGGLSVGNNSGLGGGIGGNDQNQTSSQDSAQTQTKPKQEDFSQYEKYKDGDSALFGEIAAGTGTEAAVNKKVAIYYIGRLTDGTVFDQSRLDKPGGTLQTLNFVLGEHKVILGMEQGVLGMKVGGKRRIIVPPSVGYGAEGHDPIPPNAVMVFDVELAAVQ